MTDNGNLLSSERLASALPLLLWVAILAVAWLAYMPGLGGVYLLDDSPNLSGLESVDSLKSALYFIFSGQAGPVGRPLALATFLPQAADWGETAAPFLRVNIAIHLLNACVLVWALRQLCALRGTPKDKAVFVAIAAAAVWLCMPLLASASLMVVQRMTTLSAFFALLGIAAYLWARRSVGRQPTAALVRMSAALVMATVLSMLAKENGALLPTYILAIESTLLNRPSSIKQLHWRAWKAIFLVLPTVLILGYLVSLLPYSNDVVVTRGFTGWERLLTESRILWQYLLNGLLPRAGSFGPFHDGYPVARTVLDPLTLLAVAGWVAAFAAAVLRRRRYPLFAFAVLWFLGGHLIESTTVPLLLYFEHRNYLPIIGPVFALFALVASVPAERRLLPYVGTAAYVLVNVFTLFSLTSLWGHPAQAFPYWQQRFPNSMQAATAAMEFQFAAEGPEATQNTLHRLVAERPEVGYLEIYELRLSCMIDPQKDYSRTVNRLEKSLERVDFSYTTLTMLSNLLDKTRESGCRGIDTDAIRRMAASVIANPRYKNNDEYNQKHQELMALISQYEGDADRAILHLEKAIEYQPSPALNKMMVVTYVAENDFEAAREFISKARLDAPYNPLKRFVWLDKLRGLSHYVDSRELQQSSSFDAQSLPEGT